MLIVNLNDRARLLHNEGGKNHWLTVIPKLPNGKSDALGARVTVTVGSFKQIADMIPVTGYLSQSDSRCHFGLGKADKADRVEIRWPDRTVTTMDNVKADQFLKVVWQKR